MEILGQDWVEINNQQFKPRALYEIPKGPGVCLPYAFIADLPGQTEATNNSKPYTAQYGFRLLAPPDILVRIEHQNHRETMDERRGGPTADSGHEWYWGAMQTQDVFSGYPVLRLISNKVEPMQMGDLAGWKGRLEALSNKASEGSSIQPLPNEFALVAIASRGHGYDAKEQNIYTHKDEATHYYPYANVRLIIQRYSPYAEGNELRAHPEAVTSQAKFFEIAEKIAASYRLRVP